MIRVTLDPGWLAPMRSLCRILLPPLLVTLLAAFSGQTPAPRDTGTAMATELGAGGRPVGAVYVFEFAGYQAVTDMIHSRAVITTNCSAQQPQGAKVHGDRNYIWQQGKEHKIADALSQYPVFKGEAEEDEVKATRVMCRRLAQDPAMQTLFDEAERCPAYT